MEARFGLGMIQFVRAVEKLCQAQYRYGIQQPDPHLLLPLLRFPIPPNPNPEAIDYDAFRAMLQDFIVDLATSEATLAGIGEKAGYGGRRPHAGQAKRDRRDQVRRGYTAD